MFPLAETFSDTKFGSRLTSNSSDAKQKALATAVIFNNPLSLGEFSYFWRKLALLKGGRELASDSTSKFNTCVEEQFSSCDTLYL